MTTNTRKYGFQKKPGRAKLTYREVINIREAYEEFGLPVVAMAETYRVHPSTIYNIIKRRTWKEV